MFRLFSIKTFIIIIISTKVVLWKCASVKAYAKMSNNLWAAIVRISLIETPGVLARRKKKALIFAFVLFFFFFIKQQYTTITLQHCHISRTTFPKSAVLGHLTAKCNKINKQTYHSLHPRRKREQTTGHRLPQASSRNDHSDKDQVLMYPYQDGLIPNHNKKKGIIQKLASDICQ